MKVKYTGTSDAYELSAADFNRAGVEGRKTVFPQGKAVEVSDEVGNALLSDEGVFAGFADVFEEADEEDEPRAAGAKGTADDPEMTESGTKSQSGGTGGARGGRTARGSTTARAGSGT